MIGRLAVLLVTLALVTTACGDDDTSDATSTTAPPETAVPDTTAVPGTTTAPGTTGEGSSDDEGPDRADIEELLLTFNSTPLRLTYRFPGEGGDDVIILSQDPTQNPPVIAFFDEEMTTKLIENDEQFIVCTPECIALPSSTVGAGQFLSGMIGPIVGLVATAESLEDIPGATMSEETVTVAGRNGICLTLSGQGTAGRMCIDSELGFMLRVEQQDPASGEMDLIAELVGFGEPDPKDFEPLGPVTEAPAP